MSEKLVLKDRVSRDIVSIKVETLKQLEKLPQDQADIELKKILHFATDVPIMINDRRWLEMITFWTPEHGLPGKDMGKWLNLMVKVGDLADDVTHIDLSRFQAELLWVRISSADFKIMNGITPAYSAFVADFVRQFGFHYSEEEPLETLVILSQQT